MRSTRRVTRRSGVALVALAVAAPLSLTFTSPVSAHEFDHPAPAAPGGTIPGGEFLTSGGEGADWELLASIPTGNPHSDLEFFTQGGETFASVGTLAIGANQGGQTIVQLTEDGVVDGSTPMFVAGHPSAACPSDLSAALGLQHDVEATPKGDTISNDSFRPTVPEDAQLLIDATDAGGRCHDQGTTGVEDPVGGVPDPVGALAVPRGGLEIIDVSDVENPVEIALTSHIGESHTVNIDPKRPHIAYSVTSDSVGVARDDNGTPDDESDDTFTRRNETTQPSALDGFEVVDLSSCMYKTAAVPAGTLDPAIKALSGEEATDAKREACQPEVFRYRFPTPDMSLGHTIKGGVFGCHELAIYPDDRLTCGSGAAAIVFDMSGAFDSSGKPVGEPLDCRTRESSSTATPTGAPILDCVNGGTDEEPKPLGIPDWLEDGAPSLEGVEYTGSVHHIGRAVNNINDPTSNFATTIPATEDIDFNHETEFTKNGNFLLATDERGGGVLGGSQCSQGDSSPDFANGGVSAYKVGALTKDGPGTAEESQQAYATSADGEDRAIYRAPIRTGAEGTFCTAHVLQQVPDQNRIFMGWYSQGTQVVDYIELPDGRIQFSEAGFAIPVGANTWVSHVFKMEENEDGTFTYFGATGDIERLQIDVFKVTLPAPLTACDLKAGSADRSEPSTVSDRDQVREVHKQSVDCVLNYKISSGKTANADGTPTTYSPIEEVSRGQMARFILNALEASGAEVPAPVARDRFTDISTDEHRDAINRLDQAGIVKGAVDGKFGPLELITRDQMASFIVEAARFANGSDLEPERMDHFSDVPAGSTHERNINAGFEAGLFQGTTEPGSAPRSGRYSPDEEVPRDQMASFLVELFTQTIQ